MNTKNPSRAARLGMALAVVALLLLSAGCNKLRARDQLNKGVQSYKGARYEEAIEHFKNAVSLDPQLSVARLYLATAYAQQYIPGADTPENNKFAEQAIDEFKKVLDQGPPRESRVASQKGIASLYFNMKKMDDAKQWHQKVIQEDPNDPETYYSIGVIDWTVAYQRDQKERADLGVAPADVLKDKKTCERLRGQNEQIVKEAIEVLNKALKLREDYDDAMAYMNLMYRQKADIECDSDEQRMADLKTADDWVDQTMAAKKRKQEKKGPGGITLEGPPAK